MILTILLVGLCISLIYTYLVWNNNHWKKHGLPHNPPQVLFGNTPNTIMQKRNAYYDIQDVFKWVNLLLSLSIIYLYLHFNRKYRGQYNLAGFFNLRKPTVLILDPSLVRRVFITDFNKFAYNDFGDLVNKDIDPLIGSNPFFLNGDEWKERRAEITPAFTVSRVSYWPHEHSHIARVSYLKLLSIPLLISAPLDVPTDRGCLQEPNRLHW